MMIYGFNKTTLLDYPEHIAATVFTGGCNFKCPFCHNASLVVCENSHNAIGEEEVLAHLKKRKGILEGVCITGGEPTLHPELIDFVKKVKELGYLVKLDTNGYSPDVLQKLLGEDMLDYVAMDIKASQENYAQATGVQALDLCRIQKSIDILRGSTIPYEFRTTVVKGIHSIEEFDSIGEWLSGSRAYFLQAYRENENVLGRSMMPINEEGLATMGTFLKSEMEQMAEKARKYIDKVELRGVE